MELWFELKGFRGFLAVGGSIVDRAVFFHKVLEVRECLVSALFCHSKIMKVAYAVKNKKLREVGLIFFRVLIELIKEVTLHDF